MPVKDTRGRLALLESFARPKAVTQVDLALRLGVTQASIAQWCSGVTRPDHKHRLALERILDIPAQDWLDAREKADVEKMSR